MALVIKDRIKETTTTTGTGTYSLAGAEAGFQGFSEIGDGNTCYYACTDNTDFEVGIGTFTASGSTLARTTILESSNSDAAVNWGSGSKDIFVTYPADKAVFKDASGNIAITGDVTIEDNEKLHFGDGQDLSIHHYADNWIVSNTGDLHIRQEAVDKDVKIQADNANGQAVDYFQADGSTGEVILSHFGYPKIKTKSTGADITGDITVSGTVDGVDISARDAVLTSTTTTANAAMPTSGGTFTGDISFEGATANDYETTVTVADPTADRTITLPDQTGTAMLWQSAWPDDPTPNSIAIGDSALSNANSSAILSTAVGHNAGAAITSGERNTLIGSFAGDNLTTGTHCTAVGQSAMAQNTTDSYTTAIGALSGRGDFLLYGTYVGAYAGNYNTDHKDYQTAIGYNAMNDQSGDYATAVGAEAMTDGAHYASTAVGYDALGRYFCSFPQYNTAVGSYSGNNLYSGDYNALLGYYTNTTYDSGTAGVAVGYQAKITGNYTTSVGYRTGDSAWGTSDYCVFVGNYAGFDMDGGDHCTFVGNYAGYAGGSGSYNTTVGTQSLRTLSSGGNNSSLGSYTLYSVTSGNYNTAIGSYAGHNLSTGGSNTFLGYAAGQNQDNSTTNALTTGSNVTCVGFQAIPSSGTATNEITLGDNDITSLRCNVQTISSLSDERDKTAIKDLTHGLDFINDMRPVEFTWNRRDGSLGAKPDMGFIAQDLYETELNHSSSSRTRLVNWENPEKLEADYVRSYPILVKAVQELSAKCDALEARLAALEGN